MLAVAGELPGVPSIFAAFPGATRDAGIWEIPAHGFRDFLLGLHSSGKPSASRSSVHSRCPDITNVGG